MASNRPCFFPNKSATPTTYTACPLPSPSTHSACCRLGEACLEAGLCWGAYGAVYRGACTDETWSAGACAGVCRGDGPGDSNHGSLTLCKRGRPSKWACGTEAEMCERSEKVFELESVNVVQREAMGENGTSLATTTTTTTIITTHTTTSTTASTRSSTPPPSTPDSSATQTAKDPSPVPAIAVSVALGILLLSSVVVVFWYRSKWKAAEKVLAREGIHRGLDVRSEPVEIETRSVVAELT